jgi:hypothetical protein
MPQPLVVGVGLPVNVQASVVVLLTYQPFVPRVPVTTGVTLGVCPVTVITQEFSTLLLAESVTCAAKLNTPAAVGVPETTPVLGVKIRPGGRLPIIEKLYGGVPPRAVSVEL